MIRDAIEMEKENGWPKGWMVKTVVTEKPRYSRQIMEVPPIFTSRDEAQKYFDWLVGRLKEEKGLHDYFKDVKWKSHAVLVNDDGSLCFEVAVQDAYLPLLIYEHRVIRRKNPDGTFQYVFKLGGYVPSTM